LLDGFGKPFALAFFAAGFLAFSFTTFFAVALDLGVAFVLAFVFAFAFLRFAIAVPLRV
jgi:hypothetical protein